MTSKITIFVRDHKRSGNTNEYQKDTQPEYIQKYSFSAPTNEESIKVSVVKGTTLWFPNQISLGVTSKADDGIMDAPTINFEYDKNGSKKDASFALLDEFKVKGIRVNFQTKALGAKPTVEMFATYRRSGNKVLSRETFVLHIPLSHRIVLEGDISGVLGDDSAIRSGIVKENKENAVISKHAGYRPPLSEDDCAWIKIAHKSYGICKVSSSHLVAYGINTEDEYIPEKYIACPRTAPELSSLFEDPCGDYALFVKFDSSSLTDAYANHRFLAALLVLTSPCYARYITKHDNKIEFIGHRIPDKFLYEESYWELEGKEVGSVVHEDEKSQDEDDGESIFSADSGSADEDEPLASGEEIEDEDDDDVNDTALLNESDKDEIHDADESDDDVSISSSKKRTRDADDDPDSSDGSPKRRKMHDDDILELE